MVAGCRIAALGLALTPLVLSVSAAQQAPPLAITGVNVVDVVDGQITANATITIDGARIVDVTQAGAPPKKARVVDARGTFMIPGMWDMHAHMEASGPSWLQLYVANGVTGLRDMGSDLDFILNLREATAAGREIGPRIFAAGPILDDAPAEWPFRRRVRTADEGRAAVRQLKQRGVDLIKVHDRTPREAYYAIAEEARRQKLPLAGHKPMKMTIEEIVEAGQTDLEHLSNGQLWRPCAGREYRSGACQALFGMLARRGVWQTPTLAGTFEIGTIGTPASGVSADRMSYATKKVRDMWAANQAGFATPEVIKILRAAAEVGAVVTADMAKAGVGILAGCDTMIAGFCVHDELAMMVRGGMPALTALQTATLNPVRYFGLEAAAGTVAAGRRADLVLLEANPLTDIANVGRIRAVILAGRFFDRKALDAMLADVRRASGGLSGRWEQQHVTRPVGTDRRDSFHVTKPPRRAAAGKRRCARRLAGNPFRVRARARGCGDRRRARDPHLVPQGTPRRAPRAPAIRQTARDGGCLRNAFSRPAESDRPSPGDREGDRRHEASGRSHRSHRRHARRRHQASPLIYF
jgi:hypothetical protein